MGSTGKAVLSTKSNVISLSGNVETHSQEWSDDDIKVVTDGRTGYFQSGNSFLINQSLRELDDDDLKTYIMSKAHLTMMETNKIMKTIAALDNNMKPIDAPMTVARMADHSYAGVLLSQIGVDISQLDSNNLASKLLENKNLLVGGSITDKAFQSSTYDTSLKGSYFAYRPIKLEISLKQGFAGAFSPTNYESEFVLPRNTSTVIDDIVKDGKYVVIKMHAE